MSGSSSSSLVAYNPDDPIQAAFLASLAEGESGGSSYALTEGVGGTNLSGDPTDEYGFPEWSGFGDSQAAGIYQFEPSTWDSLAAEYNLNFGSAADQSEGAWYLAQQTYATDNGGASLYTALQNGNIGTVQSSLASVWPSVTETSFTTDLANALTGTPTTTEAATAEASSGGLGSFLSKWYDNTLGLAGTALGTGGAGGLLSPGVGTFNALTGGTETSGSSGSGWAAEIENWFLRFGLIVIGVVVILVALWMLLSQEGRKVARSVV